MVGLLAVCALMLPAGPSAAEGPIYHVAVIPRLPPAAVHRNWAPLVERLARDTGLDLRLKLYETIPAFERDLLDGVPDLAFMNPYQCVLARRARGYSPLVRDSALELGGILVVRRDSPVTHVRQLDGKVLAFPAPNAFGASLYLRALLIEEAGIRFTARYVVTHSNVYRNVILGFADGGGGVNVTLDAEPPEVRDKLRVVFETPRTAPHPLGAHPRVPQAARDSVVGAILRLARDPGSRGLLRAVHLAEPTRADFGRDYAMLENLALEKYLVAEDPQ
jgi:phosphonate transport system substrate-binding protein